MAISWPGHINDPGGIRRQFHHLIDIVPTILEATGIPAPDEIEVLTNDLQKIQLAASGQMLLSRPDKARVNGANTIRK